MVKIRGKWTCSAEFMDNCVGREPLSDVVLRKGTVYLVFENGHEVPLLCPHCEEPWDIEDLDKYRRQMVGRRLVSMLHSEIPAEGEDQGVGEVYYRFTMEFSPKYKVGAHRVQHTALASVVKMRHPARCPFRTRR
jgi:hypothetical protein